MKTLCIAALMSMIAISFCSASDKTSKKDQSIAADLRAQLLSDIQDEEATRLAAIEARHDAREFLDKFFYTQDIFRADERLRMLRRKLNDDCS